MPAKFNNTSSFFQKVFRLFSNHENKAPISGVKTPQPVSSKDYRDQFLEQLIQDGVSTSTLRNYASDINQFIEFCGDQDPFSLLSEQNFRRFFSDQQRKGLKTSSIQRKIVSLKLFSDWVENNVQTQAAQKDSTEHLPNPAPLSSQKPVQTKNAYQDWILGPYFHLATLIIFLIFITILGYRQFFTTVPEKFAFPTSPVTPERILSFQARLTDTSGTPITTATNTQFRLYDAETSGTQLWSSGTCSIDPDQDGIFSTILGDTCGSAIASSVFTENAEVWLEIQVVSETLTPRQRIATVPYALNSETLQGFPINSTESATTNTVLVMNEWGEVLLGEASPRLRSVSGTFTISGQTLNLTTNSGSNGNVVIDPDGTGITSIIGNLIQNGYLYTNGATISATYAGSTPLTINGTGGQIVTINNAGDITTAGDIAVNGGDITSTGDITINPAGGNVIFADGDVLNIGGAGAQAYNFFAGSTTGNSLADSDNDLYIEDELEVDGNVQFDGNVTLPDLNTAGGIVYTNSSGQLLTSAQGVGGQCLQSGGSGTPTWGSCGGAGSNWRINTGALSPINDTLDLLVGSTATASAKFAIINVNSGTPTASLSAGAAGGAYLTAAGTLQTTANQTLTIGGDTTGNISISPLNGSGTLSVNGSQTLTGDLAVNGDDITSDADLTITPAGGNVLLANNVAFNVGGAAAQAYNFFAGTTTGNGSADGDNDLYIEDELEVDGGATFDGPIAANNDLTVAGTLTGNGTSTFNGTVNLNGAINLGDGGDAIAISGTTISLTANGAGNDISFNLVDNNTDALDIQQGTNDYINVSTVNSAEVITFGNSTTNPGTTFAGTGNIGIGATPQTGKKVYITQSSSANQNNSALQIVNTQTSAVAQTLRGIELTTSFSGTSGTQTGVNGLDFTVQATGNGGTVTNMKGISAWATVSAGATVSDLRLIHAVNPTNSGTLNTAYGIYIDNITAGSTNYSLYSAGGDIYFGAGDITMAGFTNNGGVIYTDGSGVLAQTTVGNAGECLQSSGGGAPTWASCATGGQGSKWNISSGALSPINETLDLLVGGTATNSAEFAVINVNSGTPTASLSAGVNGGTYLTATGILQTTANQSLTLGGATTGDITLSPLNGAGGVTADLGATRLFNILDGNLKIGNGTPGLTQDGEDAYIEGTLEVDGQAQFDGNVDATNGLDVTTANLTVGGANFTVAPGTGNITTAGDLALNGDDLTADGDLTINVDGNVLFADGDVLNVGGATAAAFNFFADSTAGNGTADGDSDLYIQDELEVDGTVTFGSTLNCSDCIDWDDIVDSTTLDASTAIGFGAGALNFTFTNDGSGNEIHNLSSTGDLVFQDAGDTVFTFNDSGNIAVDADHNRTTTFTSTLTGGTRSSSLLTLTQANDGTNDSSASLLSVANIDTASNVGVVSIEQRATSGVGLTYATNSSNASTFISSSATLTTGKYINFTGTGALTSGNGILFDGTTSGAISSFTGDMIRVAPARSLTSGTGTITDTGSYLDISRSNTVNSGGATFNTTGDLVSLVSNCTQTAGTCTDSSNILSIAQSYASATGDVVDITNAGTGIGVLLTSSSTGNLMTLNSSGAVTTADGLSIAATNGSGVITDAIDVSDAEIVNAINVGANVITGTAYTISNSGAGNDITIDSIDQIVLTDFTNGGSGCSALETDGSGNLTCGVDDSGSSSPFTSAGGIIDKTTVGDRLRLLYGDAADVQFEIENTTNAVVPTADAMQINLSGGSGVTTDNVDGVYINIEGANGTSTDVSALHLDFDPISGSSDDTFTGLLIDGVTGTSAVENAITVGSGWDSNLFFNDTTTSIQIADTGVFTFEDSAGNDLMTLTDNSNAGDLAITGNLTVTGGTITGPATMTLATTTTLNTSLTSFNCTDCINWDDIVDSTTLDASTSIGFGAGALNFTFTNDGSGNEIHNLSSTGDLVLQDNGDTVFTFDDSGNTSFAQDHNRDITITSDLSASGRTTDVVTISQANDGTANSNSQSLLQVTNSDTSATAAVVEVSQAAAGTGILVTGTSGAMTGFSMNTTLQSGVGLNILTPSLTTGSGIRLTGGTTGTLSNYSGDQLLITPTRSHTGATTITESGNYIDVQRALTVNNAGGTVNITGDLVTLTSNCTQTAGSCTDTSNVLSLAQNYASATGAALDITNAGTGEGVLLTSSSTGNLMTLNSSGAVTTADGLSIAATNGSGVITDAIDVSDAEIVNAINVGANVITGTAYTISNSGAGNDITFDSIDQLVFTDFVSCATLTTNSSGHLTCGTGSSVLWNNIGDPDGNNTINLGAFTTQFDYTGNTTTGWTYNANSLTTAVGQAISTTALTSGSSVRVTGSGATMQTGGELVDLVLGANTVGAGLTITSTGTYTGTGSADGMINIVANSLTTGLGSQYSFTGLTTGSGLRITGGTSMTTNGELIDLNMGAATAGNGLNVTTTGVYTGTGLAVLTANSATTGVGQAISMTGLTTGTGLSITGGTSMTTNGELLDLNMGAATAGNGANITTTGVYTGTGLAVLTANSATTGVGQAISMTGLTTGSGLRITGGTSMTTNGELLDLNMGAATAGNGSVITTTGVYTGTGLAVLTANSATTGVGQAISMTGLTTGTGMSITGGSSMAAGGELLDLNMGAATAGNGMNITTTGVYTGTGLLNLTANSATTGNLFTAAANGLTTGDILNISSTSTVLTTGNLGSFDWSPSGSTEIFASGNLFNINVGQYGNIGKIFNIQDNGSDVFSVGQSIITSALPHEFTAAGDVSVAYDVMMTNQTASAIRSSGPLTIEAGESFENNDLTLTTYGTGALVVSAAGGSEFTRSGATVATFDRTSSDGTIISLQQATTEEGTISVSGTTVSYNAFTGSHYAFVNGDIQKGELVTLNGANTTLGARDGSEIIYGGERSSVANDSRILGAYLALLESNKPRSNTNPELVMAVGNGVAWVVENGEDLQAGDYLISSDTPGHAMKDSGEFDRSFIVARVAEPVDWNTVTETTVDGKKHKLISVLYESFVKDNILELALDSEGDLSSNYSIAAPSESSNNRFSVISAATSQAVTKISTFAQLIVGEIQAGLIKTQELVADRVTINQKLTAPQIVTDEIKTKLVSPTDGQELTLNLGQNSTNELNVTNNNGEEIASIDQQGNAEFEGNLDVAGSATISGDLSARSGRLEQLAAQRATFSEAEITNATISGDLFLPDGRSIQSILADNQDYISSLSAQTDQITQAIQQAPENMTSSSFNDFLSQLTGSSDASISAAIANLQSQNIQIDGEDMVLAPDAVFVKEYLNVSGYTQLNTVSAQSLTVANSLLFTADTIATSGETLFIQPVNTGRVNILAGLLVLNADGNAEVNGNLIVSGDVKVGNKLNTNAIQPNDFSSDFSLKLATQSAVLGETTSSKFAILDASNSAVASIDASGSARFKNLAANGLTIAQPQAQASDSASLAEADRNSTAGSKVLPALTTELVIENNNIDDNDLIYLTPTSDTANQVLFIKSKETCSGPLALESCQKSFTVGIKNAVTQDINFNYWIVRVE